jgi:hypothetical protein
VCNPPWARFWLASEHAALPSHSSSNPGRSGIRTPAHAALRTSGLCRDQRRPGPAERVNRRGLRLSTAPVRQSPEDDEQAPENARRPAVRSGADMWRDPLDRPDGTFWHPAGAWVIVPYLEMRSLPQVTVTRRATIMIRRFPGNLTPEEGSGVASVPTTAWVWKCLTFPPRHGGFASVSFRKRAYMLAASVCPEGWPWA